jgi:predicted lipoprotein
LDEEGNLIGVGEVFNAERYVDGIWETNVLPAFQENALPIDDLIQAIEEDPQAARQKYGRQLAVGGPFTFMVEGEGQVVAVEGPNLMLDLSPYDGKADMAVRLGPVFTGTEVRDALDFIKFKDFRDVTEYFSVANELNKRVRNDVVSKVDKATAVGKTVVFVGAFGLKDKNDIVVVPVILEVR